MLIEKGTHVRKRPEAIEAAVGNEVVLMVTESGKVFALGETGSDVWRRLQAGAPVGEVVQSLAEEYNAPEARLEADVARLILRLHEYALVELH